MEKPTQIYGIRAIIEAINADEAIDKIFIQKGLKGDLSKELEGLIRKHGINVSYVPPEKLHRLTKNNHQGVIANISPITFYDLETLVEQVMESKKAPLFLLLDQLSDVRNFGAIIRTAECTGVDGIIIQKKGSAPVTADTIKTSAGAAFKVPIVKVDHIKDAVFYLQASGISVTVATEKTNSTIYDASFNGPSAIVMGAEDKGVSPSVIKAADQTAKLPLMGEIGSLNVSVACGVFLYEVVRQRMDGSIG
ncbi:23S rRNA (guanosine(2251)-2'-O)-methyltransferase RlmB [Maribacter polysaccharolyticus]|uniref:23S rRNA (guanosine(2251)-2'-O)-methyltransferase RlmB n=1 Tax=Maribacter polysaccharolyticus TaxID=3020831 RepID=UPI00237F7543|nr:23S rRNA (guanosine(2251)-2'-O)-methyltransferase RlmB [Maribacter polysaccharolyticus]MDE3741554.1 23S rRNA (guanosine(2251)-2'-O)-methyltransferase RlmB [Maribacter polysaccharolyticus]